MDKRPLPQGKALAKSVRFTHALITAQLRGIRSFLNFLGSVMKQSTVSLPSLYVANKNQKEQRKQNLKLAIRRLLPKWFLSLIRRRQVPLKKMQYFLSSHSPANNSTSTPETISIIVPCYGHGPYLEIMFTSIIKQTRLPDEVILINDYSPDETGLILKRLVAEHQAKKPNQIKFTILTNDKNLGQALTLNRGIETATSDLIMILNDDDYLMHDAVETMFYLFKQEPGIALIGGSMIDFGDNHFLDQHPKLITKQIKLNAINLRITTPADALAFEDYCSLNMAHSASTFIRTKALAAGLYRPKKERIVHFSDRDFQIRMNLLYPVGSTEQVAFSFWRNNSSVDNSLFT